MCGTCLLYTSILWYINEYTGDKAFESFAKKWTEKLEPVKTFKGNHDIGFMMYCSFGNAYRLTQNEKYKDIPVSYTHLKDMWKTRGSIFSAKMHEPYAR